ncbi:putative aminohydrolase SsnA [Halanaerobium sp. MA284_MarDTE_T2]|uniref:putative aminohydrolase SsnA n=1 Tax=Halanaerobium sp. MA284_MarDTE_T2 TaxID=2183913 RepID=UPI000DF137E2|nr:putative aminohydrolase SsnA [Halanaerobium sp. MA284_MarDTE_T2]RCW50693.1 putative selenium metabolism protein SsnA [Halanaerobium sp. MA284_MarDTE_T2]
MYIIGGGTLITHDEKNRVIKDGGLLIDGERIKELGKTRELKKKYPDAVFKDYSGKIIMPGMINTHMHFYSTFARGMDLKTDRSPRHFLEILEKLWWRLDNSMNKDDIYYSAIYAILCGIKQGTTTIFDHHASYGKIGQSLSIITDAVRESGIRADLAFEISDRNGSKKSVESLKESERFLKEVEKDSYLSSRIGLHASFTLEDKTLTKVRDIADKYNSSFHIHAAEGRADLEDSRFRGFNGVVKRLDKYNIWRSGTIAVHGVHLQEEEMEILKDSGSYLIHNPESNMNNAVGLAPVKEALEKGLIVGLGTDGYTTDMFESLKVADLLIKHGNSDPRPGWSEIPEMVFKNNALIAEKTFKQKLGVLKEGAAADVIAVNYDPPTEINSDNSFAHILFGINGGMVDTTIVGGKFLMENQEVKILDYEKIAYETRKQSADFWNRF